MIVGQQKPLEEIWGMIKDYKKVLVFGCNTCVAVCHQGGNKEAEILASMLKMKASQEGIAIEITNSGIERQCEHEFFEQAETIIQKADAILSTACGIGVQFMAEKYPKPIYPGLNTTFLGAVEQLGVYTERCQACGQCILGQTAGICPIARCAKRVMNGPCGGSTKGKCEINKEVDCAWQLIVDRLALLGRMDDYEKLAPIKDWSSDRAGGPRKLVREDMLNE
ncbi:Methylene-tetrahydrofolate reductase C terminal domain-containing protein [Desulfonema limicola]|uniref:Methylene-tetrahydrofolate reductase C terminal domain-containing protein n=1 Tax=Desulfonema limicola TaxID=45656 RepID=A0A975B8M0_9BACT|nr:methylenetetrahydrofolate reductase C-terminal domain-containing protein [Desulfonema limicola]QTA80868.1 Methylene-tetrahydrofolate reductase C terminal domain-containing protein [Desulfonema limicola]